MAEPLVPHRPELAAEPVARRPRPVRQAAAAGFCKSIKQHGILLTTEEIRRQYDRYNQSEHQDAATQEILGRILDCIEAPSKSPTGSGTTK